MAHRVRLIQNAKPSDPLKASLIVILAKADLHESLRAVLRDRSPVVRSGQHASLDLDLIRGMSKQCRSVIHKSCPEFVACAEATARKVLYIPASALGCSPEETRSANGSVFFGIKPERINPLWVEVPFLLALESLDPASFPGLARPTPVRADKQESAH